MCKGSLLRRNCQQVWYSGMKMLRAAFRCELGISYKKKSKNYVEDAFWYTETVKHIVNECTQYMEGRDELMRQIKAEKHFLWCKIGKDLHKVVLYSDKF